MARTEAISCAMIEAGARLIERRTDLGKYSRRHLAEDVFWAMSAVANGAGPDGLIIYWRGRVLRLGNALPWVRLE